MTFLKAVFLATVILGFVYGGVCNELEEGCKRVNEEINPLLIRTEINVAVSRSILVRLNAVFSNLSVVKHIADILFFNLAEVFLEIVKELNKTLSGTPAASCLTGVADKIITTALNAPIPYMTCVQQVLSQVPGLQNELQDILTRRNAPIILYIAADLAAIVTDLYGTFSVRINSRIDDVLSLVTSISEKSSTTNGKVEEIALAVIKCAEKATNEANDALKNIVGGLVTCAANHSVTATPPALPVPPSSIIAILIGALESFASNEQTLFRLLRVTADLANNVKNLIAQIVAQTAAEIESAIDSVVKQLIEKLKNLIFENPFRFDVIAAIQATIDEILKLKNEAITAAVQVLTALRDQAYSLLQQLADLTDVLKRLLEDSGSVAILECGLKFIHSPADYVQVCVRALLTNVGLVIDRVTGDIAVIQSARDVLENVFKAVLPGSAKITLTLSTAMYNKLIVTLSTILRITI